MVLVRFISRYRACAKDRGIISWTSEMYVYSQDEIRAHGATSSDTTVEPLYKNIVRDCLHILIREVFLYKGN